MFPVSLYAASLVCLFNIPLVIQDRNDEMRDYLVAFLKNTAISTHLSSNNVFKTDLWLSKILGSKVGQGYNNNA